MDLKGGIIIIGSLFWDSSRKRAVWRDKYFKNEVHYIRLPIRYGRQSSSRMNTYTMAYSLSLNVEDYGQGIILECRKPVSGLGYLKEIVENTIRVERDITQKIWKLKSKDSNFTLDWGWGVLGLSINPKYEVDGSINTSEVHPIVDFWEKHLSKDFKNDNFSLKTESPFVDKNGMFKIQWTDEIEHLDFLISTIVEPKPETSKGRYPSPEDIARRMYQGNYYSYFIRNLENGILTRDDSHVIQLIREKYNINHYIEKNFKPEVLWKKK